MLTYVPTTKRTSTAPIWVSSFARCRLSLMTIRTAVDNVMWNTAACLTDHQTVGMYGEIYVNPNVDAIFVFIYKMSLLHCLHLIRIRPRLNYSGVACCKKVTWVRLTCLFTCTSAENVLPMGPIRLCFASRLH